MYVANSQQDGALNKNIQRFHHISADLTDPSSPARIIAEATEWNSNSPPDIVWCCHGSSHPTLFTETPLSAINEQMSTNYFSNAYLAHATLKAWLRDESLLSAQKQKNPEPRHLIFTSSFLAFLTIVGYGPYSPTKAALRSLADTLSNEVRLYESTHAPIRVHTLFPATIFTEGFEAETKLKFDVTKKLEEDDGGQTPEEVARLCIKGLENGDEMVTTTLMTRLAMAGMFGVTKRNGWVLPDLVLSFLAVLAFPFIRIYLNGQVKTWGKENKGSGMKQK